jgi:hypothetical protein
MRLTSDFESSLPSSSKSLLFNEISGKTRCGFPLKSQRANYIEAKAFPQGYILREYCNSLLLCHESTIVRYGGVE